MSAALLSRVKNNDEFLTALSVDLPAIERQSYGRFPHWRESVFNFQVSQWIEALNTSTNVEGVTVEFSSSDDTLWDRRRVAMLLQAIGALPSLKVLICQQKLQGGARHLESLLAMAGAVETAKHLTHFEVWNLRTTDGDLEHVRRLVYSLQSHGNLKSLKITLDSQDRQCGVAILPVLQSRTITKLGLSRLKPDAMLPLIEAVHANTILETLNLYFYLGQTNQVNDNVLVALADALKINHTIRSLSLGGLPYGGGSWIGEKGIKTLVSMMESNFSLLNLRISGQANANIDFYAKLNRAGRGRLFEQEVTPSKVLGVLSALQGDVGCIFFVLLLNPSLCGE